MRIRTAGLELEAILYQARVMGNPRPRTPLSSEPNSRSFWCWSNLMKLWQRIVGSGPVPRGELTQRFWDYVKHNNLQDAEDSTQINADDALKAVFDGED